MQLRIAGIFLICTLAAFAQGDRGTITGTVSDATGAVVPNASIQVTNSDTAAVYQIATTSTGNYHAGQSTCRHVRALGGCNGV